MARSARAVWTSWDRVEPLLSLAESWHLEPDFSHVTAAGRCQGQARLGGSFRGWLQCACASTRRWGKRGDPETEALGRSRGGFSTKLHLRAEGGGKPLTFRVTAGQRHEAVEFERLMEQGTVKRATRGRPKLRPRRVVGDKGYRSKQIRQYLRRRGIRMTIPRTTNERRMGRFDRAMYRERNRIERLINRLKQYRRIATRYEKRAVNYLAMLTLVAIRLWL